MNIKWDADRYTNQFSFVHQYGNALIDMIEGDKLSVLDLGCGNGALTKKLAEKGHDVMGMDASAELLEIAKKKYPDICFVRGDAIDFHMDRLFDVVFSNAVFHWIDREKQPDMISCVWDALKPGGQFVFEFGGFGNNVLIHNALQKEFRKRKLDYVMPFYFPTIGEYASLLEQEGFLVKSALLSDRPTKLEGENGLYDWINMFLKAPLAGLDAALKEEIICSAVAILENVLFRDGKWYADYVRLRCKAVKGNREFHSRKR